MPPVGTDKKRNDSHFGLGAKNRMEVHSSIVSSSHIVFCHLRTSCIKGKSHVIIVIEASMTFAILRVEIRSADTCCHDFVYWTTLLLRS